MGRRRRVALLWLALGTYLAIEWRRYVAWCRLRTQLSTRFTAVDRDVAQDAWSRFFRARCALLCHKHRATFVKWVRDACWRRELRTLDPATVRTALDAYDRRQHPGGGESSSAFAHAMVDALALERAATPTAWIRINGTTNHAPATPLFPPLGVAVAATAARWATDATLRRVFGFVDVRCDATGMVYWRRAPVAAWHATLCVFHGLGLGFVPYVPFLRQLCAALPATTALVLVEMPGLSGHATRALPREAGQSPSPATHEVCASFEAYLGDDARPLDLLGHSYGGMIASALVNNARLRPRIRRRVFVESPVFLAGTTHFWPYVFQPLTYADVLRRPRFALIFGGMWTQHVIRHTTWFQDYVSHEDDLGANTLVVLSSDDNLVPVAVVDEYLRSEHPDVKRVVRVGRHGDAIFRHATRTIATIVEFLDT